MSVTSKPAVGAFTLVEMLVSIAVVSLLMLTVVGILSSATILTGESRKQIDADNEARAVFDRMTGDFNRMVNRTDVDYIFAKVSGSGATAGANDTFFFYSEAPALASTTSTSLQGTVALIGYNISSGYQLQRLGEGLILGSAPPYGMSFLTYPPSTSNPQPGTAGYVPSVASTFANSAWQPIVGTGTDTPPYSTGSTGSSSDFHVLGPDVFRLEFCFLLKPQFQSSGTLTPAAYTNDCAACFDSASGHAPLYGVGLNDVQAIVVAVAILDANSRKILTTANMATLTAALTDSQSGNLGATPPVLMSQTWKAELSPAQFSGALQTAVKNVRVYQRTFYLSPFLNNP